MSIKLEQPSILGSKRSPILLKYVVYITGQYLLYYHNTAIDNELKRVADL